MFGMSGAGKSTLIDNLFGFRLKKAPKVRFCFPLLDPFAQLCFSCFQSGVGQEHKTTQVTKYPLNEDVPIPLVLWDHPGAELALGHPDSWVSDKMNWVTKMTETTPIDEQLHLIFWVINVKANRIHPNEKKCINQFAKRCPVAVVLTHCDVAIREDIHTLIREIETECPRSKTFCVMLKPSSPKLLSFSLS